MTTYTGTQTVKGGYYLNVREWDLKAVDGNGGALPGDPDTRYVRIPLLAMLVVAPTLGLTFVMLLPFLGLAVLLEQAWHKVTALATARREAKAAATTARR